MTGAWATIDTPLGEIVLEGDRRGRHGTAPPQPAADARSGPARPERAGRRREPGGGVLRRVAARLRPAARPGGRRVLPAGMARDERDPLRRDRLLRRDRPDRSAIPTAPARWAAPWRATPSRSSSRATGWWDRTVRWSATAAGWSASGCCSTSRPGASRSHSGERLTTTSAPGAAPIRAAASPPLAATATIPWLSRYTSSAPGGTSANVRATVAGWRRPPGVHLHAVPDREPGGARGPRRRPAAPRCRSGPSPPPRPSAGPGRARGAGSSGHARGRRGRPAGRARPAARRPRAGRRPAPARHARGRSPASRAAARAPRAARAPERARGRAQQPVVRPHQEAAPAQRHRDRAAASVPTPGSTTASVDGARAPAAPGRASTSAPVAHVARRDVVGQVDAVGLRAPRRDHRVQGADVLAARPVVGQERDHRAHGDHPTGAPASASSADDQARDGVLGGLRVHLEPLLAGGRAGDRADRDHARAGAGPAARGRRRSAAPGRRARSRRR